MKVFIGDAIVSLAITVALFAASVPAMSVAGTLSCSVATTCNSPSVVVYRMSSTTNAHAELPSGSTFTQLVCCSGLTGLSNSCSGNQATVLLLKATTNSHVEQNSQSNYTNKACISVPSGTVSVAYQANNCTGFDTTVGSMSAATNAHVGTSTVYTTRICASGANNSLTFLTDSSNETLPALTPGSTVATSSILTVTTGNTTGFNITAQRVNASATLLLSTDNTVTISDKTVWSAPGATTSAGNATASTTQPQTLQFRVRFTGTDTPDYASSWWGSDDTTANASFAGFPTTAQNIINRSTIASATTTMYVLYNAGVPVTQQTGSYSGGITYSATANP